MHCDSCIVCLMNRLWLPLAASVLVALLGAASLPAAIAGTPHEIGPASLGLRLDLVPALLLFFVGTLLALISLYAGRNLRGQERLGRFAALLAASAGALTLLVAGSSLVVMAMGWTLSGWLLAGLVAHRRSPQSRRAASYVARWLTVSDIALWGAVLLALATLPSVQRADLAAVAASPGDAPVTAVALLLVAAAIVRSALLPAWRWLPATAEAPSPVSAYLHAGVVNGGGMLLILLWPLVATASLALALLIVAGSVSVIAASAAMRLRADVKGQLAASTTAQMGYMGIQIGLGLPAVALLHLIGHGFYKAWQFLRAGGEVTRRREALVPVGSPNQRARFAGGALAALVLVAGGALAGPAVGTLLATFGPVALVPVAAAAVAAAIPVASAAASGRATAATTAWLAVGSAAGLAGYLWAVRWWDEALYSALPAEPTWAPTAAWAWVAFLALVGGATVLAVRQTVRQPHGVLALRLLAAGMPPLPRGGRRPIVASLPTETDVSDPAVVDPAAARILAESAARLVGPAFPLRSFVAASPLAGLQQWEFPTAAETVARTWGADAYLPEEQYRAIHAAGRITDADLRAAGVADVAQFLAVEPPTDGQSPEAAPDRPEQLRARAAAALWTAHVWAGPGGADGTGLYAAWRAACAGHGLGRRLGIPYADALARTLPADPAAAVAVMGARLGGARGSVVHYASLLLARQPGWTAHAAWRVRSGDADAVLELLALRMAIDLAAGGGRPVTAPGAEPVPAAAGFARREVWQRALEAAARRPLIAGLSARATDRGPTRRRAAAQLLFCIDVRSERMRRHLEAVGPYDTYGYAGFFGAAVGYQAPSGQVFDQCPVLLTPASVVTDPRSAPAFRSLAAAAGAAVKAPVAPWALAEASGMLLGLTSTAQTIAPRALGAVADAVRARTEPEDALPVAAAAVALPLADRVDLARAALQTIGLTDGFAPIIVIVGHGATVQNNAFAAGYDCGACGGNPGLGNARLLASALNDWEVREQLQESGIRIPEGTVAVAAMHNTTTDVVTIDPAQPFGPAHEALEQLRGDLAAAGAAAAAERCQNLPGAPKESGRALQHASARSLDWAEAAPELGLLGNAAFVAGPRWLTEAMDLRGRVFLHSYEPEQDLDRSILRAIVNAPVVVAHWINSQYYFSAVDPERFGSGDKTMHNVVGDLGVVSGAAGDLRIGLPWQALVAQERDAGTAASLHEPLRLTVALYAATAAVDAVLADSPDVALLIANGWLTMVAIDPGSGAARMLGADLQWGGAVAPPATGGPDRPSDPVPVMSL